MKKIIDLTHIIDPSRVQRKFAIETIGADEVNRNVIRDEGQWYIMTNIQMVSHIATHIEVPYHLFPDGYDLSTMPVEHFYGPAVVLDFRHLPPKTGITREAAQAAAGAAGGIRPGDVVLCNLGYADVYGTEAYGDSPYFTNEALRYLVECGMKMMGVDAGGVEIPKTHVHENHSLLFENNIPLIENVAHLNDLPEGRFEVSAFPYPIKGVESFIVRVIAYV